MNGPLPCTLPVSLTRGGVERLGQRDARALLLRAHGLELHVLAERLAATLVHDASGGADVRVGEARDVLLEEVDEPAFALEEREELQRGVRGGRRRGLGLGRGRGLGGWGRRGCQRLPFGLGGRRKRLRGMQLSGIFAVEQHPEEHHIGEPEARQERERGRVGHGAQLYYDVALGAVLRYSLRG